MAHKFAMYSGFLCPLEWTKGYTREYTAMYHNPAFRSLAVSLSLLAACGTAPVDIQSATDAGAIDASRVNDLGVQPDLSKTRDLAMNGEDMTSSPDMVETPDLAPRENGKIVFSIDPAYNGDTYVVTHLGFKTVRLIKVAVKNVGKLPMHLDQFTMTGAVLGGGDTSDYVGACQVYVGGMSYGYGEYDVTKSTITFAKLYDQVGNVKLADYQPGDVGQLDIVCDPTRAKSGVIAFGVASASDVVAYDTVHLNVADVSIDQALIDNASMQNPTVLEQIIVDRTVPDITLNGGDMTLIVGDQFIDPGATALDMVDGIMPVTEVSVVDTMFPGVYLIKYTSADLSGNGVTVGRTVTVIPPFCGFGELKGNRFMVNGRVMVSWSNDTPVGIANPSYQQFVGKFVVTALPGVGCQDIDLNQFVIGFLSNFPLGKAWVYKDYFMTLPIAEFPAGNADFAASLAPHTATIAAGSSRAFYIALDTTLAKQLSSVSVRVGYAIKYTTLSSGDQYETDADGYLPLVYKTLNFN